MKKYRSRPLVSVRPRSDDGWDDYNLMEKNITVYESEAEWQPIGILGPDGSPIECLVGGMEPIGFVHFCQDCGRPHYRCECPVEGE